MAVTLRGYENLVTDIFEDPSFAHEILKHITEKILAPWIQAMKKECPNADLYRGADAMASMPLVDIPILTEFVVPYILKLKALCDENVTVLNWWGESQLKNPEELLDLKLQISPTIIQGQDPDVEKIGPELYKNFALKNDAALILGIGNTFLQNADPTAIRSRIGRYIEAGVPEGRLMIYFCYLGRQTPLDNIKEAIQSVKAFGT